MCVCVFLFSIDRAYPADPKKKTSVVAGKKKAARFVIGTRWVMREGYPSTSKKHISCTRLVTNVCVCVCGGKTEEREGRRSASIGGNERDESTRREQRQGTRRVP